MVQTGFQKREASSPTNPWPVSVEMPLAAAAIVLLDHPRAAQAIVNRAGRLLGAVGQDGILNRLTHLLG